MNENDFIWSVFVGGSEVNDYYMRLSEAKELADEYVEDGYIDVWVIDTDGNEIEMGG